MKTKEMNKYVNNGMRYKFKDLYDLFHNKWVLTINEEENEYGSITTCELHGVYDTKSEMTEAMNKDIKGSCGFFKMVKEEDEIGFIFVAAS